MNEKTSDSQYMYMRNDVFIPQMLKLMEMGHRVTIRACGWSMRPFIEHNRDELIFGAVKGPVKKGDVVLAEITPGVYVCHRVDAVGDQRLRLRGDGNVEQTEICGRDDVKAVLESVVRKGKTYNLSTSRVWHVYSWWWVRLLPARRYLLTAYRLIWLHVLPSSVRKWIPLSIKGKIKLLMSR